MNRFVTAWGLAASLVVGCKGMDDQTLRTGPGAGGSFAATGGSANDGASAVGGAAGGPGATLGAGGAVSFCRLAPPCPSGWYQYSDTVCSPPSLGSGPGCSSKGDGLCYQPCTSSVDCSDPMFRNCTELMVFDGSDVGRPRYVCTSGTPAPACASNPVGSSGGGGGPGGGAGSPGGGGGPGGDTGGAGGAVGRGGAGPASAELLATMRDPPWGVAVDATTVYVAAQSAGPLFAIPLAGGLPTQLASTSVFTVAIDETRVYWSDGTSIYACAKQDCAASTVALAPSDLSHGIAVDATNVYWTTPSEGKVMKVAKKGGTAIALASGGYPYQIAVDDANVYWTNQTPGSVMKVPIAGGTPVQLATGELPMGIAVDGSNVYFTTINGTMMQVPKGGGDALMLSPDLGYAPWGIATDGKNVYGASGNDGTIIKVPVGGGAATVLAWGQGSPAGVAVDATHVYWADVELDKVMRVAK
jgi:hypothetical protein